ncbi:hypothetical protein [Paraclostridium sordellii]|uniref:hypothetical protein n=1 Tax=Paraclostridium sordellii TaxID=1505 RepID=UPI0022E1DB00|nr:hypothetical protein [Paeniclostridium sordellii]
MAKEEYFRKLIVKSDSQSDIVTVFNNLQNWSYNGIVNGGGVQYHELVNINENAKVLFNCNNSGIIMSINVLPINMDGDERTVYRYGYDFSENQVTDIKDDILFDLCKEINNSINDVELYCGIVPSKND